MLGRLGHLFLDGIGPVEMQTRSEFPGMDEQMALARRQYAAARPWRVASTLEALGVPGIFRAVTLISNTASMLALEAFRNGVRLEATDIPRIVQRPNPLTIPREFLRDTVYAMASRGEAWWWISKRDTDGSALSLYPVPPNEIVVEKNDRNRLQPVIRWAGEVIPNEDMRQIVMTREPGALRGQGPLQICGAAVSVGVEAQEWAANFFAGGGQPSAIIKSAVRLTEQEAKDLKDQWMAGTSNTPKVVDDAIESVDPFGVDPAAAQLSQQRQFQNGEIARMFGIPGSLLDYNQPGAFLTYQNVEGEYTKFVRTCLQPNYLEPVEQALSDLLTRSTVARFNVDGLLRADIKTRFEVHKTAIDAGVYDAEYAQRKEGIQPGDIENAPVPFALPQAIPTQLPVNRSRESSEIRCPNGHLLAELASPPYRFTCFRCKSTVAA